MSAMLSEILWECWSVLGQMSPYLLFGFLAAGVLSVCIPADWVERHLGRSGMRGVLAASLVGVPLPLCSCSVIPVSASIRRHGASRAATTSFLLSTPQTGVDSIAVTYALMGTVFAVFRPVVALATGILGGLLVRVLGEADEKVEPLEAQSCCCTQACCEETPRRSIVVRALAYGFITLPRDIGLALLVGVAIAGAMSALVTADQLEPYLGGGIGAILLMMAAGVPVYVCATASVPIAVGFMHVGASPGAALAFLIAGPATNAATFTTLWKLLGGRSAALYLLTVGVSALGGGLLLDALFPEPKSWMPSLPAHVHDAGPAGWLPHVWALVLLAVLGLSYGFALKAAGRAGDSP